MRALVWFTLGFGSACALGTYLAPGVWGLGAGALALAAFLPMLLRRKRGKVFGPAAGLCLGFALGSVWFWGYDAIFLRPARLADGTTQAITVEVGDFACPTDYGCYVDGKFDLDGRTYGVRLYLDGPELLPEPGDRVRVTARLRLTTDGGSGEPTYHRSKGIFLLAYGGAEAQWEAGEPGLVHWPVHFRRAVGLRIEALFSRDTAGFAKALLLGDRSGLTYAQQNEMSLAGISHVVAVSGMHLSILFALVFALTFRRRVLSAVVGIPVLFAFAAVAGFTPSVTRAAVMLSLALGAGVLKREYDAPTALAFAALCLLAQNPTVAASASFQLSVGAVAGILCFSGPMQMWLTRSLGNGKRRRKRVLRALAASVSVTLGATVFTAPLAACTFGVVSLVAPVTNLLTLWAVSLAFYGAMATCVLGLFWVPAGSAVAWVISWLVRYILGVGHFLGNLPFGAVFPKESVYIAAWVVFALMLFGVFVLGKFRGKPVFFLGLSATLLLSVLLGILEPKGDAFRVTVLDVGQGQCVLLQAGGRTYVVDCGGTDGEGAGEKAARHLLTRGIASIDGLILTHFDEDHVGGTAQLLARINVERVYMPQSQKEDQQMVALAEDRRIFVEEDLCLTWVDTQLQIFAPLSRTESNESGLSVLFTAGEYDTLITGDMSHNLEARLLGTHRLTDVELLVAGHHGAKSSTSEALLNRVLPEVVAISVGRNAYGHPAADTLARIQSVGSKILRTDVSGTLIFRG